MTVNPFDLQPPEKLLLPKKYGRLVENKEIKIGYSEEAKVTRRVWQDGTVHVQVEVPCENLPHCHYCECGSEHYVSLTVGQVAQLKSLL